MRVLRHYLQKLLLIKHGHKIRTSYFRAVFGHYFLDNRSRYYLDIERAHREQQIHYFAGEKSLIFIAGKIARMSFRNGRGLLRRNLGTHRILCWMHATV